MEPKSKIKLLTKIRDEIIEKWIDSGLLDEISYFHNRVAEARTPRQKIRPMNHLILVMINNILKKHCI